MTQSREDKRPNLHREPMQGVVYMEVHKPFEDVQNTVTVNKGSKLKLLMST